MKKSFAIIMISILVCALLSSCTQKNKQTEVEDISRKEVVSNTDNKKEKPTSNGDAKPAEEKEPEEDKKEEAPSQKTLEEIRAEIISSIGASDSIALNADSASSIYGIDPEDISQAAGFVVMAGTFPHEIIMIEAVSSEAADRVATLFEVKLEAFTQQSKGYDAKNYALAQKCKVEKNGKYVSLFLSPNCEDIKSIYNKYIK